MKIKLMSFGIDVPAGTQEGDEFTNVPFANHRLAFVCVRVDGELVLRLTHFDGEKVPE